jgi:alkylated DNA repair protein alkB homolog 6
MHYYDVPACAPVLSLLLEPRSLVITARDQYTTRAHGINAVAEDRIGDYELANVSMLDDRDGTGVLYKEGGILPRQTRYSLTCRDVPRVMNVSLGTRAKEKSGHTLEASYS